MGAQHIFLSAHLDDVVLSCGGMMFELAKADERVQAITVFAGDPPDGDLSPFAQSLHARWQASVADRRAEDRAALALLGVEAVHWSYADAVYRRDARNGAYLYDSEESIFRDVRDVALIASIAQPLRELDAAAQLYAPLAAGHHVDHQIVRRAAESSGRVLIYYEDYPYAEKADAIESLVSDGSWTSRYVRLSEFALQAKIQALLAYRSQISTFYNSDEEVARRLRGYASRVGGIEGLSERVWLRAVG